MPQYDYQNEFFASFVDVCIDLHIDYLDIFRQLNLPYEIHQKQTITLDHITCVKAMNLAAKTSGNKLFGLAIGEKINFSNLLYALALKQQNLDISYLITAYYLTAKNSGTQIYPKLIDSELPSDIASL